VIERMVELGFNVHRTTGSNQTILAGVGTPAHFDVVEFQGAAWRTRRLPHLRALQAGGAQLPAGGHPGRAFPNGVWSAARRSSSWPGPARSNRASRSC